MNLDQIKDQLTPNEWHILMIVTHVTNKGYFIKELNYPESAGVLGHIILLNLWANEGELGFLEDNDIEFLIEILQHYFGHVKPSRLEDKTLKIEIG